MLSQLGFVSLSLGAGLHHLLHVQFELGIELLVLVRVYQVLQLFSHNVCDLFVVLRVVHQELAVS